MSARQDCVLVLETGSRCEGTSDPVAFSPTPAGNLQAPFVTVLIRCSTHAVLLLAEYALWRCMYILRSTLHSARVIQGVRDLDSVLQPSAHVTRGREAASRFMQQLSYGKQPSKFRKVNIRIVCVS